MSNESVHSQVKNGFRIAGLWLLGMAWLGLVFAGMAIALTPSRHRHETGWGLLAIAAAVLILTMDKWVKILPGLLAYGVLGGILTLVDGHAINHPEVMVPRYQSAIITLLCIGAAMLSFSFGKHKLSFPDRIALFAFVLCFFLQATAPHFMLAITAVAVASLIGAWLYDRFFFANRRVAHPPIRGNDS